MKKHRRSLGICIGASTVSSVLLGENKKERDKPVIIESRVCSHLGDPQGVLVSEVERYMAQSPDFMAITGRHPEQWVDLPVIAEPLALESAYRYVKPENVDCQGLVSAGGEAFMAYGLDGLGRITGVFAGNKCASGTGEFFSQQLGRMGLSLDQAMALADCDVPHRVSARCSVFCKSDCTHATNKGVPKTRVIAGLCKMMADKIVALLVKIGSGNIMLTGGVAQNRLVVHYLRRRLAGLIVPDEAPFFEALGAGVWALGHESGFSKTGVLLSREKPSSFETLPRLSTYKGKVRFETLPLGVLEMGGACILGLDVGSTTTKAVLMEKSTRSILCSTYLRTDGDPVGASQRCYRAILGKIVKGNPKEKISIIGVGVCGSGRYIAGLHAGTDGIINEITAHAAAAAYFDPDVDTIFEIGGQDAKYTRLTNGVAVDYAMNEACSAGTGSFLEEAALETLGIAMEDIEESAMAAQAPPNFSDQCAAFIGADVKTAIQEGLCVNDISAGLVYSVCMNYLNRVKGNRSVGATIFMQGGVCYNRAVPAAMAGLLGCSMVVPPEPGLMGAFGAALVIQQRLDQGEMQAQSVDLARLMARPVKVLEPFVCKGGKERCDRGCEIALLDIDGRRYPFGGACNRYDNLRNRRQYDVGELDLVRVRQHLVFEKYGPSRGAMAPGPRKRIGLNRSFFINTYYPLYANFFARLGVEVVLPETCSQEGIDGRGAAFCRPGELSHGFFKALVDANDDLDYLFLPHVKSLEPAEGSESALVCPLVQGEPSYLSAAFATEIQQLEKGGTRILKPLMDFSKGLERSEKSFIRIGQALGHGKAAARSAFRYALARQRQCFEAMKQAGRRALAALEKDPDRFAVVVLARPYNGFAREAHMGIPAKFASRGVMVIPHDFLSHGNVAPKKQMYWGMGDAILRAGAVVKQHPQLFGTYVTSFSCGPDSFVLGYYKELMGQKPSLVLELDSHRADAGIETRIEAFLDIIKSYRNVAVVRNAGRGGSNVPARVVMSQGNPVVITSSGEVVKLKHPRVKILVPSLGELGSQALAGILRSMGFNALALPPADEAVLSRGRAATSGRECLPLILTTGTLLNYVEKERRDKEVVVYFFATGSGPCRFGQYQVFMEDLIRGRGIRDVALMTLSSEDAYVGFGTVFERLAWWAIVVSDVMEDIRSMVLVNAVDRERGLETFQGIWKDLLGLFETGSSRKLKQGLGHGAACLAMIPLKTTIAQVPGITLTGEIFVRRDPLSRRHLTEVLADKGITTVCSPVSEWVNYCNYMVDQGWGDANGLKRR
ncbi:MAG: activase [Desulfobacterium sp.]|nr:activase [Desulfobacterium sp.]